MNNNLVYQKQTLTREVLNKKYGHQSFVIWLTGLSGSGKSTIANELNIYLYNKNVKSYILDGDNTRLGINKDLDFSDEGRKENIRRVSEIAKLFVDAGLVVITSFISPFEEDRTNAKNIIGNDNFIEVFVNCPLEICESRDVKGLYKKARKGEIKKFTGIDSPFEAPKSANITVNTHQNSIDECVKSIIKFVEQRL
jgi:adenylylsulfate kinase